MNLNSEEISEMLKYFQNLQEKEQKEKEKPEHYYEFTGTWSFGVWATSREAAIERFNDAIIEDFDILTDEYKVEQYE